MIIKSFASSSKGNCYLISDGETNLLMECGISIDKIRKFTKMNFDACLITHEHKDHALSLTKILQNCKNVFVTKGTFEAFQNDITIFNYVKIIEKNKLYTIKTFQMIPFETEHDAAEPVGFYLKSNITNETILFATDTYYIKNRFKTINYLMIECNYAYDLIKKNIENDKLPKIMAKRLLKSHFELENVKKFILQQDLKQIKEIYLLHLSSGNSDATRFKTEIKKIAGCPVWVCPE